LRQRLFQLALAIELQLGRCDGNITERRHPSRIPIDSWLLPYPASISMAYLAARFMRIVSLDIVLYSYLSRTTTYINGSVPECFSRRALIPS